MKVIKNIEKKTEKLPMSPKVKCGFRFYCSTVLAMALTVGLAVPASAAAVYLCERNWRTDQTWLSHVPCSCCFEKEQYANAQIS